MSKTHKGTTKGVMSCFGGSACVVILQGRQKRDSADSLENQTLDSDARNQILWGGIPSNNQRVIAERVEPPPSPS